MVYKCQYCESEISKHDIKKHERKCYNRPENIKKIYEYLLNSLYDISLLNKDIFYSFTKKNKILNVISITQRLIKKYSIHTNDIVLTWEYIIILLILDIYYHAKRQNINIDLEYLDMLIYKLTWGCMGYNRQKFKEIYLLIQTKHNFE